MSTFDDLDPGWLASKPGVKWSRVDDGTLAAWVADMDFPIPDPVAAALHTVIDGGCLGYPNLDGGNPLAEPFVRRMRTRHGWDPKPERVWAFTDVLNAVQAILALVTGPGDAVAIHTPTYPPFLRALETMGRQLVPLPFQSTPDGWRFDLEHAEAAVAGAGCRVLVVVNPHNPTGRVLDEHELRALAVIAERNDLLVISDEVHAELLYPGRRHVPFAALSADTTRRTVTLNSASKSFNLAGIRCAVAHFGSDVAWTALTERPEHLFGVVSNLGIAATLAAWRDGDEWLDQLLSHLEAQRRRLGHRLAAELPRLRWHEPEGTYLAWLDFRPARLDEEPAEFFRRTAGVELSPGRSFGKAGAGFARLNFATSHAVLDEILTRLAAALPAD